MRASELALVQDSDDLPDFTLGVLGVLGMQSIMNTVLKVSFQHVRLYFAEGGGDRMDLVNDVNAVAPFFNHALDPAHLSLDATEPGSLGGVVRMRFHEKDPILVYCESQEDSGFGLHTLSRILMVRKRGGVARCPNFPPRPPVSKTAASPSISMSKLPLTTFEIHPAGQHLTAAEPR